MVPNLRFVFWNAGQPVCVCGRSRGKRAAMSGEERRDGDDFEARGFGRDWRAANIRRWSEIGRGFRVRQGLGLDRSRRRHLRVARERRRFGGDRWLPIEPAVAEFGERREVVADVFGFRGDRLIRHFRTQAFDAFVVFDGAAVLALGIHLIANQKLPDIRFD